MMHKSFPSKIIQKIKLPYLKYRKCEIEMIRLGRYCWPYINAAKKAAERLAVCGQGPTPLGLHPPSKDEMKSRLQRAQDWASEMLIIFIMIVVKTATTTFLPSDDVHLSPFPCFPNQADFSLIPYLLCCPWPFPQRWFAWIRAAKNQGAS